MKKILVIEDDKLVTKQIMYTLKTQNYVLENARNGVEGIEKAKSFKPDLIVCDIMMPQMNGFKVLETLKETVDTRQIPFIFVTSMSDKEHIKNALKMGAEDFITKPFTANELLESVRDRFKNQEIIEEEVQKKFDKLRRNIIYAMPHEFQTPVTTIYGFSELLYKGAGDMDREKIKEVAEAIMKSADRLINLIHKYIDYSRIEVLVSDPAEAKRVRESTFCNLIAIITSVCTAKATHWKRIDDLSLDLQEANVFITIENLSKIVEELIDNAFKFSEPGTPVHVKSFNEGDYYVIKIIDNGRGIKDLKLEEIGAYIQFERNIYEQQGSGFGLIMVKRLVEIHNGVFYFDSIPGQETTFTVKLRLKE